MTVSDSNAARPVADLWAGELVEEFARCGMRHCCISPGSRSTPLVVRFDAHPDIETISIIDERSAAFFALGIARATGRPVGLVCTSGTAAANWMPAVCEADRARVPLILMTADRPPRLRATGSPQSMDQLQLYGSRVRWFHECGRPEAEDDAFRALLSTVDFAWQRARDPLPGPVHLNLPFRKPLEPLPVAADHRDAVPEDFQPPSRPSGGPFSEFTTGVPAPDETLVDWMVGRLADADRPLFVCGADRRGAAYREPLVMLAETIEAPIVAEPTSQLRYGPGGGSERRPVIGVGDYLFDSALYAGEGAPDLIVRTGEAPLTWAGRRFSGGVAGYQVSVQPNVQRRDPDHVVDRYLVTDPGRLFEACRRRLAGDGTADGEWLVRHRRVAETAHRALTEALSEADGLEEPRMWWELQRHLPSPSTLFVSNSMPVRNLDMYAPGGEAAIDVYFNRGLNGIDGIASTGMGVAAATDPPTVVVTGDVAFRHDVGALAAARRTGSAATLVVVDNGGGAIFDQLPIAECGDVHERQFVTAPQLDVGRVGEGFDLPVAIPEDWQEFGDALREAVAADDMRIVWVRTDRSRDKARGEAIRRRVVEAIDRRLDGDEEAR